MPIEVKTSAKYGELGDLSTFSISTSAIPTDVADSSGSVPTISSTFVDGKDVEYLIGEDFSLETPALGKYDGEIVNIGKTYGSAKSVLDVHNIMSRLNTEHRLYPMADYNGIESVYLPVFTLEYWTQQCGIFYSKVPGKPLFFQSQWGHFGAWAKDITRPLKTSLTAVSEFYQSELVGDRMMNNFPRNSLATLTLPDKTNLTDMGTKLPVLITTTGKTVFGTTFKLSGTGRRGHVTWLMIDPKGVKKAVRITADTTVGFTLSTSEDGISYTARGTVEAAADLTYTVYVGVSQTSTTSELEFTVLNSDSSLVGTRTATLTGSSIRESLALTHVLYGGDDVGSGSKLLYADVFISQMDAMPTECLVPQKLISTGVKSSSHMVGFSGNVWEHMKQFCAIYHLDVNYRDGKLTIEPRQRDIKVGTSLSTLNTSVLNRETARNVEVVNQRQTGTGTANPKLMWSADTVYQVAVGEVQEFKVQTKHSIMSVSQPVCVSGITPFPYVSGTGQYVVTGSDGYIVSPSFWNDQGGSVTCDITEVEGEILIRIKGPDFDSTRAPYRISEGDAGRPALHITGTGVKSDPITLKVPTGNAKAAKDVGVTIDNPFVGNTKVAYDVACRAAQTFATPEVSMSFMEPVGYDEESALGKIPAGQLMKKDGNIFRIKDASQTPSQVSGNASQHNTIYQLKRSFQPVPVGEIGIAVMPPISEVNAYYDGKPIGRVNIKPLKEVK